MNTGFDYQGHLLHNYNHILSNSIIKEFEWAFRLLALPPLIMEPVSYDIDGLTKAEKTEFIKCLILLEDYYRFDNYSTIIIDGDIESFKSNMFQEHSNKLKLNSSTLKYSTPTIVGLSVRRCNYLIVSSLGIISREALSDLAYVRTSNSIRINLI